MITPMVSSQLLQWYRHLSHQCFTVVDVETSGIYPEQNRVIELSVLQATLADGIRQQRTTLLNPEIRLSRRISEITGIQQEMVARSPLAAEVFPQFAPLLSTGVLTAHNLATRREAPRSTEGERRDDSRAC
jgi:DNA polymerase-3 subunit epsilon